MFVILSMDGWDQLAYSAMNINDVGLQPLYNNNPGPSQSILSDLSAGLCENSGICVMKSRFVAAGYFLYFFFAVLWNYFFILQLYIGIFVDNLRRSMPASDSCNTRMRHLSLFLFSASEAVSVTTFK
jgi:hypothetical protein